jgi:hypothetical protein
MSATRKHSIEKNTSALYLAFELGLNDWKLGFGVSIGTAPRLRTIGAATWTD